MFDFLKPYVGLIKTALIAISVIAVLGSYIAVYKLGVSRESDRRDLKEAQTALEQIRLQQRSVEDFNRRINEQKQAQILEMQALQGRIKGFEDYVASIQNDSECLTGDDTRVLRNLFDGDKAKP